MMEVQKLYNLCTADGKETSAGTAHFLTALAEVGVNVRDYPEHKMWLLDYDQIECVKDHPVVNECRGLLMGYDGSIIRKGFTRFYNLGENGVDTFDFKNSIAFEKADGSLMFVYYCPATKQWEIGTRGTAFAEGPHEWLGTFRNFMLNAMGRTEEQFQQDCNENLNVYRTYLFEAVGPDNRIVTRYDKNHLVYLSSFSNLTFKEDFDPDMIYDAMPNWNVREVRQYRFNTQEDCLTALGKLTGLQEGYVVYNKLTGGRVKIKSPAYLAAHRLRGNGLTMNAICELVSLGEEDEYISVFKEDEYKFIPALDKLNEIKHKLSENYAKYKDIFCQKEFALTVKDLPYSSVMFKARKDKCEIIHAFNSFPVGKRAEWLKDELLK